MRIVFVCSILFVLALFSCQNPKVESAEEKKPFFIKGADQQVVKEFPDGKVRLALYTDVQSKRKVAEVEFHPNGQPKIDKRFINDTLQGETWCYYENGSPWSLNTFDKEINHGAYKTWHDNGQLYIQGQYEHGQKSGEWFTYFANGSLNTRGFYTNDQKTGVWNSYNLEGTMKREQDFDSDSLR